MDGESSDWSYWVPYDPDVSAALQRLREEIFERGDYLMADSIVSVGSRLIIPPSDSRPKPATIKELQERVGKSGTHSILDMTCISPTPKRKAISPLPESSLKEYFGSMTPAPSDVQEIYDFGSLEKFVTKRWRGIYIVAYFEGEPSDIFFAGCSGD
jgi:hypothetical protein